MSEIADAFRRIEHPNVRTNTSVQPFNCALRSFAQACLQRMKQQLYWVKVRRILRQAAQACTDSLDRLFHTPNLVEGDIVDHHNVPALERWDQTLLYVSQEGLSIHGSFDQHRSHDAGLTQRARPLAHPGGAGLLWAINGGRRSSNYIEIGQSSNWLRTDRGTSLNVGVSTQGRSRCHGSSAAVARGTCNRCDQKTRRPGLAADCRLRPKP